MVAGLDRLAKAQRQAGRIRPLRERGQQLDGLGGPVAGLPRVLAGAAGEGGLLGVVARPGEGGASLEDLGREQEGHEQQGKERLDPQGAEAGPRAGGTRSGVLRSRHRRGSSGRGRG